METVQVRRRCFVRQAKTTQAKCLSASCFGAVWQNRCKQMCRLSLCGISFRQPYLSSRGEGFAWRDLLVPARAAWRLPSKFGRSPTNRERLFSISDLSQFHYTTLLEFVKIFFLIFLKKIKIFFRNWNKASKNADKCHKYRQRAEKGRGVVSLSPFFCFAPHRANLAVTGGSVISFVEGQHTEAIDRLVCSQDDPVVLQVICSATGVQICSVRQDQEGIILTGMDRRAFQNGQITFSALVFQPPIPVIVLFSVWCQPFQLRMALQDYLAFIVPHIVVLLSLVNHNIPHLAWNVQKTNC